MNLNRRDKTLNKFQTIRSLKLASLEKSNRLRKLYSDLTDLDLHLSKPINLDVFKKWSLLRKDEWPILFDLRQQGVLEFKPTIYTPINLFVTQEIFYVYHTNSSELVEVYAQVSKFGISFEITICDEEENEFEIPVKLSEIMTRKQAIKQYPEFFI